MRIKFCKFCENELYGNSSKCPWCRTPVKKITALEYSILILLVLPVVFLLVAQFFKYNYADILPFKESFRTRKVNVVKAQHPMKGADKNLIKVYVKGKIVNLRQRPTTNSPTLWKLKKEQRLTQVARSGNWSQVLVDGVEGKRGWVHASLIEKRTPDQSSKAIAPHHPFNAFRLHFAQFNAEIEMLKGTTYFESVEYLDRGVIQVTATDIFLSAPEIYKKTYIGKITKKWLTLREPGLPATVNIVDTKGILRMKQRSN